MLYNFKGKNREVMQLKENLLQALIDAFPDRDTFAEVMPFVDYLQRAGATIRKRYENECSYEWAANDPKYTASTESREKKLMQRAADFGLKPCDYYAVDKKESGHYIAMQGDCRGCPVIVRIGIRSYSIGA